MTLARIARIFGRRERSAKRVYSELDFQQSHPATQHHDLKIDAEQPIFARSIPDTRSKQPAIIISPIMTAAANALNVIGLVFLSHAYVCIFPRSRSGLTLRETVYTAHTNSLCFPDRLSRLRLRQIYQYQA